MSSHTVTIFQGELVFRPKQQPKIMNIEQWTDAFLVFTSIYCQAHPGKFQDFLKYINNIRIAEKRCHLNLGWKQCDVQF